jgi:glycosyltransferase involved in cell wall biosynthesis
MARVLYITYDGLLEPLGQSQVWQYLRRLANGHRIVVVSFEKPEDLADARRMQAQHDAAASAGVTWRPLRYHRRPSAPATAYDIAAGLLVSARLVRRHGVQIVHARSYVPGVIALALKRTLGTRFLFDMRGFWPDEKLESGAWKAGSPLYRAAKWFERRFLTEADAVVSLTQAAVHVMRRYDYLAQRTQQFEVIPTCTDLAQFSPRPRARAAEAPLTLGCVGSVGLWYLFDDMLDCFVALRRIVPDARLLILNRDSHTFIRERLAAHGLPEEAFELKAVEYARVADEMSRMDAGLFFIRPVFSKTGSAPTKLGEFLGCGIPCLGNAGVGDYAAILEGERVGVALRDFSAAEKEAGVKRLLELLRDPQVRERCTSAARLHFSADKGAQDYDRLYRSLAAA